MTQENTQAPRFQPDPDDPWIERPEHEIDSNINIGPKDGNEQELREELLIKRLTNKAPRPMSLLLIDMIPIIVGMLLMGVLGYLAGFIGKPGDSDPTGALFGIYGIQATLIVSVAFLPKTLNQLTFSIIQVLVTVTSLASMGYSGFHFGWFSEELGLVISISLNLFSLIFSSLSIAFAYGSRHWRTKAHRREERVLKNNKRWTRWRLRRANLMAYREWCWRHDEDPERFEQILWESGAFALTYKELDDAADSPALDDFLDSRQGIEEKDSRSETVKKG